MLEYCCVPVRFEQALFACEEFLPCIAELEAHGFSVELPCGVKRFVHPELYEAAVVALELRAWVSACDACPLKQMAELCSQLQMI